VAGSTGSSSFTPRSTSAWILTGEKPASCAASIVLMPRSLSWLMYSTNRIEFLVTRTISRIMRIWL